ncbi:MAG: hypothetical protein V1853_03665 [bacterium]
MEQAQNFVANIDWATPTWDLFIILFFIVAGFLYGLSLGRDRIVVILVSIYMALAVASTAPFIGELNARIGIQNVFVFQISAFVLTFIVLFFLLSRSALLRTIAASDNVGSWWQVLVFSILHVGLLISITLSFLPPEAADNLSPLTRQMFAGDMARFVWIISPIVLMAMIKTEDKNRKYKYDI